MRKYIFIKDESYSSNLFTNMQEYLNRHDDLNTRLIGQAPYKIKLMPLDEAKGLVGNHPMMLSANTNFEEPYSPKTDKIALVSFGGAIVRPKISELMKIADREQVGVMVSEAVSNNEAELLSGAYYTGQEGLKNHIPHYCYMMMTKLKGTDVYYLVLNPALVCCSSHIEIEGDVWIEEIKGIKDTIKDSIFSMKPTTVVANHILSGGMCGIEILGKSIVQSDDHCDFLKQLKLRVRHRDDCYHHLCDGSIFITHRKDTHLVIEIENELLGDFINDNEKLRWEFIITGI